MTFKESVKSVGVWISRVLEDTDGVPSSKRIQAFFLIAISVWIALKTGDVLMTATFLGAALALQGITAFQR